MKVSYSHVTCLLGNAAFQIYLTQILVWFCFFLFVLSFSEHQFQKKLQKSFFLSYDQWCFGWLIVCKCCLTSSATCLATPKTHLKWLRMVMTVCSMQMKNCLCFLKKLSFTLFNRPSIILRRHVQQCFLRLFSLDHR